MIAFLKLMDSTSLVNIKDCYTFITFNIIHIHIHKCICSIEFPICERNIYINKNKSILLDRDKLLVFDNDPFPVMNDRSLGRYTIK